MSPAWFLHEDNDTRAPEYINVEDLFRKTGVAYIKISDEEQVQKFKKEKGFSYENILEWSDASLDYQEKIKTFHTEHLHPDEEMRYFLDGSGYFDVRDKHDQWIRIALGPGVLIILPPGVYHRFTLGDEKYIKVRRFFKTGSTWVACNRPAESEPHH